jgi:hypothetical protein
VGQALVPEALLRRGNVLRVAREVELHPT